MPVGPSTVASAVSAVHGLACSALRGGSGRRGREVEGHLLTEDGQEFDVILVGTSSSDTEGEEAASYTYHARFSDGSSLDGAGTVVSHPIPV